MRSCIGTLTAQDGDHPDGLRAVPRYASADDRDRLDVDRCSGCRCATDRGSTRPIRRSVRVRQRSLQRFSASPASIFRDRPHRIIPHHRPPSAVAVGLFVGGGMLNAPQQELVGSDARDPIREHRYNPQTAASRESDVQGPGTAMRLLQHGGARIERPEAANRDRDRAATGGEIPCARARRAAATSGSSDERRSGQVGLAARRVPYNRQL